MSVDLRRQHRCVVNLSRVVLPVRNVLNANALTTSAARVPPLLLKISPSRCDAAFNI